MAMLATVRLRFLFIAAKIKRQAGQAAISYMHHYEEKDLFHRLMNRLRGIIVPGEGFAPVIPMPLE